jgi:hypothetical protein
MEALFIAWISCVVAALVLSVRRLQAPPSPVGRPVTEVAPKAPPARDTLPDHSTTSASHAS